MRYKVFEICLDADGNWSATRPMLDGDKLVWAEMKAADLTDACERIAACSQRVLTAVRAQVNPPTNN